MSSIDTFFDTDKTTRTIPCDMNSARDLRATAHEYRPEIGLVKVDASSACVRAYTHDGSTVYVFDCSAREGDIAISIAQLVIGLGRFDRSLFSVPECLINKHVAAGEAYWIEPE